MIPYNYTLLCDFYELTMANGYFLSGKGDEISYFDVFFRRVPDGGGFAIAAGLEQVIDYISNLHFTAEDLAFLRSEMAPIFQMAYHNLSEDDIQNISNALARTAYLASRQGVNIFDSLSYQVLPLEATKEYDIVGGAKGHIVDNEANEKAIKEFLFAEDEF